MKLTKEQIEKLSAFTRKHYVVHYDLQTELVDHLSNGIEEQWQQNPKLSFDDALQVEFKKFGVFGFMDVVDSKRNQMNKRYYRLILNYCKEYFKFPKILLILGCIFTFNFSLNFFSDNYKLDVINGVLLFAAALLLISSFANKKKLKEGKRWLLKDIIYQFGNSIAFFYLPIYMYNWYTPSNGVLKNIYLQYTLSIYTVAYLFICFVMIYIIPKKANKLLRETYSEYSLV
ncbi:hypothetical protein A5M85_07420 [Cellulophaga lytica]|uniref:hypothetical protein n=1 Tax=Cellulophaga lytica TaxID=979 RepID=UPI000950AEEF|nr:hypothetical protein [Cellulophaga lytica]APU10118.1 hypothetical protein A5M85_07420 [Cellulophaga lytica]